MKKHTGDERVAGAALILAVLVIMATLPVWAPLAVVALLATRRSLLSCGREANRMSGMEG